MSKTIQTRVEALEKQSGIDSKRIFVSRADDKVLIDGELVSIDELKLRYPDAVIIRVIRVGINLERV